MVAKINNTYAIFNSQRFEQPLAKRKSFKKRKTNDKTGVSTKSTSTQRTHHHCVKFLYLFQCTSFVRYILINARAHQ
eukprot:UN23701